MSCGLQTSRQLPSFGAAASCQQRLRSSQSMQPPCGGSEGCAASVAGQERMKPVDSLLQDPIQPAGLQGFNNPQTFE